MEYNLRMAGGFASLLVIAGYLPFVPHLLTKACLENMPMDNELVVGLDDNMLLASDYIAVCGDRITNGMRHEIQLAAEHGIRFLFIDGDGNINDHTTGI